MKKNNQNENTSLFKVTDKLNLPQDVFLGSTVVTISGTNEVYIENYKGLIQYDDKKIVVQCKKLLITINGNNLKIEYFSNINMKIKGNIKGINYN